MPSTPPADAPRGPWSNPSIAVKLPLALAVLLSVAFGAMTLAVHRQMRASVLDITSHRLEHGARQLADLLAQSVKQRTAGVQALTQNPAIVQMVTAPDPSREQAARDALRRYASATSPTISIELWSPDARRILTSGASFHEMPAAAATALAGQVGSSTTPVITPYRRYENSVGFASIGAVREGTVLRGYVVDRRRVGGGSSAGANLITGLLGERARILIGGATSWSDLTKAVDAPPAHVTPESGLVEYQRAGEVVVARALAVPGAPWLAVVEFPRALVFAPVRRLLVRVLLLASIVVVGATAVGWWLSRRLTTPLRQVTEAAEAVAGDGPAPRLQLSRGDEIGRLADAFNTMADRVEESRRRFETLVHELEHRVDERTAELRAANADLESFSYSVSHDLRAPLRSIGGFATILSTDHAEHLPPDAQRSLATIERNANHMAQLIDDLLAFSRLGRQSLTRSRIDMTALARSVAAESARAEPDRSIAIHVDELPPASGEPSLIPQVFANFLQNAIKFTRPRRDARIDVGSTTENGETVYFVRDNGVGFDMRYADKLFGVFQRLHRTEEFEGTGVGLAIVQRIVQRHGGRVWAEGEVDKGATFYFTLPGDASV
jgi:signal transduction histidine kinase